MIKIFNFIRSALLVAGALSCYTSIQAAPMTVDLNDTDNAVLTDAGGGISGTLTAPLGDINGDGYDDVLIGGDSKAYVFYGAADSSSIATTRAELDGSNGFSIDLDSESVTDIEFPGGEPYYSGHVVALASGDFDADGLMDAVITWEVETNVLDGETDESCDVFRLGCKGHYLTIAVYGSTLRAVDRNELLLDSLDDTQSWVIHGREPARDGIDAADVNGDGRDDVIFTVQYADEIGYIVYSTGAGETDLENIDADSVVTIRQQPPTRPSQSYPFASIKAAGDINGDGIQDMLVGGLVNPGEGGAYPLVAEGAVIFGDANLPASVNIDDIESGVGFRLNPQVSSDIGEFNKLTSIGDINADGYDDLGMPMIPGGKDRILVVLGSADNTSVSVDIDEDWFTDGKGFVVEIPDCDFVSPPSGLSEFDRCDGPEEQVLLSAAGDINNDGIDDMVFGKYYPFVIYGRETWPVQAYCDENNSTDSACYTPPTVTTESIDIAYSPGSGSYRNEGIGPAGDVNGDGVDDLILPWYTVNIVFGVTEARECIDTDGDGWGWDGEQSCRLTPLDSCDYSDAHLYNGWGWNAATMESCAPLDDTGACDYSNASLYNGWGWNAVTMESCPPLDDTGTCDYSNASQFNGWGWNPVTMQSCPPLCVDTDGDGWGWNGSTSCVITTDTSTIYDPVLKETVDLQRLNWQTTQIIEKNINCVQYTSDDNNQNWIVSDTSAAYFDADGTWSDNSGESTTWSIESGQLFQANPYPYVSGAKSMFLHYGLVQGDKTVFYTTNPKDYQRIYFTDLPSNTRFGKTVCDVTPL